MLSKTCIHCSKEFFKDSTESVMNFTSRRKYCSKDCMDAYRRGKPSCSPETAFKNGHTIYSALDSRRKRYGQENNMWKGGQIELACAICGNKYLVDLHRQAQKTCSKNCDTLRRKTPEFRNALASAQRERVRLGLHNFYRGATEVKRVIRESTEYKQWREAVYSRDSYRCIICGTGGELNADHIKAFAILLIENNIKTLDDAINCKELWDVENGRTLCVKCHRRTDTYGILTLALINKKVEQNKSVYTP